MNIVELVVAHLTLLVNMVMNPPGGLVEKQPVAQEETAVYAAIIKAVVPGERFLDKPSRRSS
jgi:hypothetical protein